MLVLAITQSTEDIATGTQVSVDCASTEHFDVPFDELAVGDSVQIRSTEAHTDGAIVAQKVFGPARDLVPEQQGASRKKRSTTSSRRTTAAIRCRAR